MNDHPRTQPFRTERFKAFVDAVVAIAMTLLILPLMESVSEAASDHKSTAEFFDEHSGQLLSFGLSFLLIATFWMGHHRQYRDVEFVTGPLLWINVAWMATIVWLPVPTAMIGQMDTDPLQAVVYIGTLIMTQVTTLAGWLYLARHRDLGAVSTETIRLGGDRRRRRDHPVRRCTRDRRRGFAERIHGSVPAAPERPDEPSAESSPPKAPERAAGRLVRGIQPNFS